MLPALSAENFPQCQAGVFPHDELIQLADKQHMGESFDQVLMRIDQKLESRGLSDREASLRAVGKPDLLRDMRRRQGLPRGDRLAALAQVLGTTADWLIRGGAEAEAEQRAAAALDQVKTDVAAADLAPIGKLPPLPLLGSAIGGVYYDLDDDAADLVELQLGEVLDYLARPASMANDRDAYALTILSDSMAPRFEPGERVAVSPRAAISIGDDVIVQLRGLEGDTERVKVVLVKRLVRRSASFIELQQFNPAMIFRVPSDQVAALHKVKGVMF